MKLKLFRLIAAFAGFAVLFAQAQEAADPYASAKEIVGDRDRIVTPNGVQESFAAELGGTKQWVTVRGADRDNPIILFIHGDEEAVEELKALEPYPGNDFDPAKADAMRKWSIQYGSLSAYRDNADYYFGVAKLSPEYTPEDRKAWGKGSQMTMKRLWPTLKTNNFNDVRELDVPIFLFAGRHDYTTPSSVAADWLKTVRAPKKEIVWFEHSAHLIFLEEPGKTLLALLEKVRPLAVKAGDGEAPL